MMEVKHGTLFTDNGKVGMVVKIYKVGSTGGPTSSITWHETYEIYYSDGTIAFINRDSFEQMAECGTIEILSSSSSLGTFPDFYNWD
jgi:hypothetical protein